MIVSVLLPRFPLVTAAGSSQDLLREPAALAPEPGREQLIGIAPKPRQTKDPVEPEAAGFRLDPLPKRAVPDHECTEHWPLPAGEAHRADERQGVLVDDERGNLHRLSARAASKPLRTRATALAEGALTAVDDRRHSGLEVQARRLHGRRFEQRSRRKAGTRAQVRRQGRGATAGTA